MRRLNRLENAIFIIGGILILIGVALPIFYRMSLLAAIVFAVGAIMFCTMQTRAKYEGTDLTVRRLRRQQYISMFFLICTAVLMFMNREVLNAPFFNRDHWKITLAIAAVFQLYSSFRLPAALKKTE